MKVGIGNIIALVLAEVFLIMGALMIGADFLDDGVLNSVRTLEGFLVISFSIILKLSAKE